MPDLFASRGFASRDTADLYEACWQQGPPHRRAAFPQRGTVDAGHQSGHGLQQPRSPSAASAWRKSSPSPNGIARYDATGEEPLHSAYQDNGKVVDVPEELGRKLLPASPTTPSEESSLTWACKIRQINVELVGTGRNDE